MNDDRPPNDTMPTVVFAAEPPETSVPGPIASYIWSASSASTRFIAPGSSPSFSISSNDS
jgi:hypothetical protein